MPQKVRTILSIQSHVVHGYVGNRAATFPLQYRGWDVDALNTVQFSNHPAYGTFKGTRSSPEELTDIYEGLKEINVTYDVILTGYIPSNQGLKNIARICTDICKNNNAVKWILDPVLGDNGRIYVSEGNVQIYKDILKSSHIYLVTPNQLELEVLTGMKIENLKSLKLAIEEFFRIYPCVSNLVVSSVEFINSPSYLYSAGSTKVSDSSIKSFFFKVQSIEASFSGSGDLFTALLTSSYFKILNDEEVIINELTPTQDLPLVQALNEALSTTEEVLRLTFSSELANHPEPVSKPIKIDNLRIIESRHFYLQQLQNFEPKFFDQITN